MAEIEPIRIRQRWALAQAIAAAAVVVGSVMSVSQPGIGLLIVVAAALSSILEATGAATVLMRLTGSRASQNVWSPGCTEDRRGLLVLAASHDAPRAAALHRLARRLRDPWSVLGGAMLLIALCCVLRLLGFEGDGLTGVQFLLTLVPLGAAPLLVDAELSPAGDGESQAVATAIAVMLATELEGQLRYLDLAVVLTGAGEPFGQGMRAWTRRHCKDLDPQRTVVLAIEAVGSGGVRYSRREGPRLLSWSTSSDLVRLCSEIAGDDEDGAFDAGPVRSRLAESTVAAISRGMPAIGIRTAEDQTVDPDSVERVRGFCAELARRIDMELAPRLHEEPIRPE